MLLNDGPEILCGVTTAPLAPAAAQYARYDSSRLSWNKPHTRNAENKYSYSGSCRPAGQGPALRCTSCKNFFFLDELGDGLLTPGFLPHQRNYKFTCGAPPLPLIVHVLVLSLIRVVSVRRLVQPGPGEV